MALQAYLDMPLLRYPYTNLTEARIQAKLAPAAQANQAGKGKQLSYQEARVMSYGSTEQYIPKTIGEIKELIASMLLSAPSFRDKSGYFPHRNAESEFSELNEGLKLVRKKIGDENYQKAIDLSQRAKAHFEADPEDKTEDGIKGRDCLMDIEDILKAAGRRKR